jgi:Spy/CpxP family protein refolding chaperone
VTIPAWLRGTAVLAVTLAAGVVIGIAYERRQPPVVAAAPMDAHDALHKLHDDLGLDPAQQAAIAAILSRRQGAVDSAWHRMRPELRAAIDSTHAEIMKVLRPDQVAKFARMMKSMHP